VGGISVRAQRVNSLTGPARIVFAWAAREQVGRFSGRGVARLEPSYKARLDLFLPGGETIVRAALVDDELRMPPGLPAQLLPPPRLLWATVGVVRPGRGAALLGGETLEGGRIRLRYGYPGGEEIRYTLLQSALQRVELVRAGDVVETVELTRDEGSRYPREAVYRNVPEFRELRLTRESLETVDSFPPDIWDPRY
jgi:hypothetical protein